MYNYAKIFCIFLNFVIILAEKPRLDLAIVSSKVK